MMGAEAGLAPERGQAALGWPRASLPGGSSTRAMRAALIAAPRIATVASVPLPVPAPGQVRIRLEGCGVCGSNLPVWEGRPWFEYPREPGSPGHEGWGIVDALGPGVSDLKAGDRVAFLSDAAFAEFDIADRSSVLKLPPGLADVPFPGEPLACAMNVFARCEVRRGQTVTIVGIGFLGALLTQLAATAGARVLAVSRRPFALQLAQRLGAEAALSFDDEAPIERARDWSGGAGSDRVIETVGLQPALDLAGELTRVRGRLIIAGYHQDGVRQVNMQLWNWRGLDVICAHEREPQMYFDGMRAAIDEVLCGRLKLAPLLTHTFALSELGEALEMMRLRPAGFLKALVVSDR